MQLSNFMLGRNEAITTKVNAIIFTCDLLLWGFDITDQLHKKNLLSLASSNVKSESIENRYVWYLISYTKLQKSQQ